MASYPDELWQEMLRWQPNAVIIILGTNDAAHKDILRDPKGFISRYLDRIDEIRQRPDPPDVFVCIPPYSTSLQIDDAIYRHVRPSIRKVAAKSGANLVDLYTPFYRREGFLSDYVHPSVDGHRMIAYELQCYLMTGFSCAGPSNDFSKWLEQTWKTKSLY